MPARRRALRLDRRTQAMGVVALSAALGTAAVELARVWRGGSAELPTETETPTELLGAAGTATLETIQVVREGYRAVSRARTRSSTCSPPSPSRSGSPARRPR